MVSEIVGRGDTRPSRCGSRRRRQATASSARRPVECASKAGTRKPWSAAPRSVRARGALLRQIRRPTARCRAGRRARSRTVRGAGEGADCMGERSGLGETRPVSEGGRSAGGMSPAGVGGGAPLVFFARGSRTRRSVRMRPAVGEDAAIRSAGGPRARRGPTRRTGRTRPSGGPGGAADSYRSACRSAHDDACESVPARDLGQASARTARPAAQSVSDTPRAVRRRRPGRGGFASVDPTSAR